MMRNESGGAKARAPRVTARTTAAADGHDIVVIGGSAGALAPLLQLASDLPEDLPAAIFVVIHTAPNGPARLPWLLEQKTKLSASVPKDGDALRRGHVHVAPPDCHLLVDGDVVRVVRGPKENRHRPAIDPLFRSAAWSHGPRVVGMVLSGTLDDGAAGLWAVKTCGGIAIVQDPKDAPYPDMPTAALAAVQADHVAPAADLGGLLVRIAAEPVTASTHAAPVRLGTEIDFAKAEGSLDTMGTFGTPSAFTCPACHGSLWELTDGELLRYRCHVGHAYSAENLMAAQSEAVEGALYAALRALEEKASASRRIGDQMGTRVPDVRRRYEVRAAELDQNAAMIRKLLFTRTA